jgi:23S rRNA (guanine745-N1)-methyltransferase
VETSPTVGCHADGSSRYPTSLDAVLERLRCSLCHAAVLRRDGRTVLCQRGHSFDIARQGYLTLLSGRRRHRGDTAEMVTARDSFLGQGHYDALRSTITAFAAEHAPRQSRLVADLAGGTGYYLASTLDALPQAWGATLDLSAAALRRASRAHPRAAAIGADMWQPLPLASRSADVVLNVFGPRTPDEIDRVLTGGGVLIMATADTEHLRELRGRLGTIGIDSRKADRLRHAFGGFVEVSRQPVRWRLALSREQVRALVAMGPSAHHIDSDDRDRIVQELPDTLGLTAAVDVVVLRRDTSGG